MFAFCFKNRTVISQLICTLPKMNLSSSSTVTSTTLALPRRSPRLLAHSSKIQICNVHKRYFDVQRGSSSFYVDLGGDGRAYVDVIETDDSLTILHTEVPKAASGQGLGRVLAQVRFVK